MNYSKFSINFLARMSKDNSEMKAELVSRFTLDIVRQAQMFHNFNRSIPVSDFYHCLKDALMDAIDRYDPRKGNFVNYYRVLRRYGECQAYENARIRREKEEKMFGRRRNLQNFEDTQCLADSVQPEQNILSIATKLDWEEFIKTKKPIHRQVMTLYVDGFSKKEIANTLNLPYTTVVTIVNNLIERFIKEGELKKKDNQSEL